MNLRTASCSLAIAVFAAMIPLRASAAPGVAFKAPTSGSTISGNIYQSSACEATGTNIYQVRFFLDSTSLNTESYSPWNCNVDTTKFADGTHTLRAVAYDKAGATASTQISVNIQNSTTSTNTPPAVAFKTPLNGATVSGSLSGTACEASASDGNGIKQVQFFMDGTALNTELTSPYNCALDTTKFADGAHAMKAVATDTLGAASTTQIGITVKNSTTTTTLPAPTSGTLEIWWKAPAKGATVSGLLQLDKCYVNGKGVSKVAFYLDSTALNTDTVMSDGMSCVLDTAKFANGTHTLKAVAYDSTGKTYGDPISINIQNSASTTPSTAPTVSFKAPTSGATLSGSINQSSACEVTGSNISKVQFYLDSTALNTELSSPWLCNLDTTKFANGAHTLMASAYNSSGVTASTQVGVNIKNGTSTSPTTTAIDPADIHGWASANVLFSQQANYNGQVIGTYPYVTEIPETGVQGTVLSNGESLRLGKETDPLNSVRRVLSFQVAPTDPDTSGAKRSELKFPNEVQLNTVYWAAFSVWVRDWGTLASTDHALFGLQVHGGGCNLSPSVAVYSRGGKTFYVDARTSPSNPGSPSTSYSVKSAEYPMSFGRWVDMVFKFKEDPAGNGFLQAWIDGSLIMDYKGALGYYTGTTKPYIKFGYYNWTSFDSARKVMLRSPVYLVDPTGSKYKQDDLRAYVNADH